MSDFDDDDRGEVSRLGLERAEPRNLRRLNTVILALHFDESERIRVVTAATLSPVR